MPTRSAQPTSSRPAPAADPHQGTPAPRPGRLTGPAVSPSDPKAARILQKGFASESSMRTQSASASGLKSSKDRAPQSAPASSASPVSSAGPNSQGADTSEYTEESEETRVRATPGARTSDAPESSAEMFTETGETFVP